jgi:hypothetical protein
MLTNLPHLSNRLLRFALEILLLLVVFLFLGSAAAKADEIMPDMQLLLEPEGADDYSYRKVNHDKTINVMLYGFKDESPSESIIPKDRKALNAFFHQHWESVKRDYLGGDDKEGIKFAAGDDSMTAGVNRGVGMEPAKLAGITIPVGKFTLGGGYTWGEKNPAYLMETTEGFIVGAGYDTGRSGFQISYLTSGQEIMGLEVGGTDIRYSSIMFGTSFRVNERLGVTATAQYRSDSDPLTTGKHQAVFTIGTKWKF